MVAVVLQHPKYLNNLAAAKRACASFGVEHLIYTGNRIDWNVDRIPRELRMKDYQSVNLRQHGRPFDLFPKLTPVCIELVDNTVPLPIFQHPEHALYVFGPEDGSVSQVFRRLCHRFVSIPSKHCLNLAATINVVLYDRLCKESHQHALQL